MDVGETSAVQGTCARKTMLQVKLEHLEHLFEEKKTLWVERSLMDNKVELPTISL
jgi:hypothetical protein